MAVRPEEITSVLKKELENYNKELHMVDEGTVLEVGDGICRAYGLEGCMAGELLEFPGATDEYGRLVRGMALNLEEDNVGIVILGSDRQIEEGSSVRTTSRIVEVPVGKALLGRVVSAIGDPMDGKGPIVADEHRHVDIKAPGVVDRQSVNEPLQTGLKVIDALIPIGRGQRELIIGDRQTGKTAIAIDTIINQKDTHNSDKPVYCIYVAIGQKQSTVKSVYQTLAEYGAMDYTVIVSAPSSEPAPLQYLAPYAGCAMGEWFRDNGMHALIVYDDLSKHAWAYRQVSLLLRRPPGREAYPGDIFNLHSRLLERAAKLSPERGGGSLTALPVIETQANDISAYIPTNVISITDGQIFLESDLFFAGVRPAVNIGLSVSRVGSKAQVRAMKNRRVAGGLKLDLARFRELAAFAQFASEMDKATQAQLARGQRLTELMKQPQYSPMSTINQAMSIYVGANGHLDDVEIVDIQKFQGQFLHYVQQRYPEIVAELERTKDLNEELEGRLRRAIEDFKTKFPLPEEK
jgi:F-type H+-transporting ATPase subunit alpha